MPRSRIFDNDGRKGGFTRRSLTAVGFGAMPRPSVLEKFRLYRAPAGGDGKNSKVNSKNTVPVLVCTDVASRGLNIPGVTTIVELQFALNVVSHLHRMGGHGCFCDENEQGLLRGRGLDGGGSLLDGSVNCGGLGKGHQLKNEILATGMHHF